MTSSPINSANGVPCKTIDNNDDTDPALSDEYATSIRPVLDAVDGLREVGIDREIKLPTIVVCGDQSVGKSSVLEQISGVQLPRGTGVVTRCPLELRLRCTAADQMRRDEWRGRLEYDGIEGAKHSLSLESAADVGPAVKTAQDEITGDNKTISSKLISLLVESPHVPNLTLIDLPGIARFVQDDPSDVHLQTKNLIRSYIERPEVIVIIVVQCVTDIQTVESLAMARDVDPKLERTMGVLTCPDMVNPGAEQLVIDTLNGKGTVKLLKGFTVVKCRTQTELDANMDLGDAIKAELNFFQDHPQYKYLEKHQYGTSTLAKRLGIELLGKVKTMLLSVRTTLSHKLSETQAAFNELPNEIPEATEDQRYLVTQLIIQFSERLDQSASGDTRHPTRDMELVRLSREASEEFATVVNKYVDPERNAELCEIVKKHVTDQRLREFPGFINVFSIIEKLVKEEFIKYITEAVMQLSVKMRANIDKVITMLSNEVFGRYKKLAKFVLNLLEEYNDKRYVEAQSFLKFLLDMENLVWTQDITYYKYLDHGVDNSCDNYDAKSMCSIDDDEVRENDQESSPTSLQPSICEDLVSLADRGEALNINEPDTKGKKPKMFGKPFRNKSKKHDTSSVMDLTRVDQSQVAADTNHRAVVQPINGVPPQTATPSPKMNKYPPTAADVKGQTRRVSTAQPSQWHVPNKLTVDDVINTVLLSFTAYVKISSQRVMDYAPLMVMQKQMTQLAKEAKVILHQFPPDDKSLKGLLKEDEVVLLKMKHLSRRLKALKDTDDIIKNVL